MAKDLTEELRVDLAKLMIMMNVPKEECLEVLTAIETKAEMKLFLDKLAEKDFHMSPEEVYQALVDTILEMTLSEYKGVDPHET